MITPITAELNVIEGFMAIVGAYEEIAASRMQNIRHDVLHTREFLGEINTIFHQVKISYKKELEHFMKHHRIRYENGLSVIQKNGKTMSILIATNTGLYGDIVRKTFQLFQHDVQQNKSDVLIMGKIGRKFFSESNKNAPFAYVELADNKINSPDMQKIVHLLLPYQTVVVYHGLFKNILNQEASMTDISGNMNKTPDSNEGVHTKWLFEPDLEKILLFFESEIFSSLFSQTIYESRLAHFASRMRSLDVAGENLKKKKAKMLLAKQVMDHSTANKKQQQMLTGMSLWGVK